MWAPLYLLSSQTRVTSKDSVHIILVYQIRPTKSSSPQFAMLFLFSTSLCYQCFHDDRDEAKSPKMQCHSYFFGILGVLILTVHPHPPPCEKMQKILSNLQNSSPGCTRKCRAILTKASAGLVFSIIARRFLCWLSRFSSRSCSSCALALDM